MKTLITKINKTNLNAWVRSTTAGLLTVLAFCSCEDPVSEIAPQEANTERVAGFVTMHPLVNTSGPFEVSFHGASKDLIPDDYTIEMTHVQYENEFGVTNVAKGLWTLKNAKGERLIATYEGSISNDSGYPELDIVPTIGIAKGIFDGRARDLAIVGHDANEDGIYDLSFTLTLRTQD